MLEKFTQRPQPENELCQEAAFMLMTPGLLDLDGAFFLFTVVKLKLAANAGEIKATSANLSYTRVDSEAATAKGWKSILLLTNESMPLQVKSGDYNSVHCNTKHNVEDYNSG